MANWFECKIKYHKLMENGATKKVSEPYLVDAMSFTEAEERIIREMQPAIRGEFSVSTVKRSKISEIFRDDTADKWYLAKCAFMTIDEKSGKESRSISEILVAGSDFKGAYDNLVAGMQHNDFYDIVSITETMIMDVYGMEVKI